MPKIDAPTVAEHVARQTQAVIDAAARLFADRGYAAVSIGDIAAEVGLRRTSLYRYFPDKAQIALHLLRRELEAQEHVEREAAVADAALPGAERAERWALRQLEFSRRPEHRVLVEMGEILGGADHPAAETLRHAHDVMLQPLLAALADTPAAAAAVDNAELITALVIAVARLEHHEGPNGELRATLCRAIRAIVSGT